MGDSTGVRLYFQAKEFSLIFWNEGEPLEVSCLLDGMCWWVTYDMIPM